MAADSSPVKDITVQDDGLGLKFCQQGNKRLVCYGFLVRPVVAVGGYKDVTVVYGVGYNPAVIWDVCVGDAVLSCGERW